MRPWLTYLLALLPWAAQAVAPEQIGSFKIVAQNSSYFAGSNEGQPGRGESTSYRVHCQGRPLSFRAPDEANGGDVDLGSELNRVLSFRSPSPALVVNAGDLNNTSYFFLLSEVDGALESRLLTQVSAGGLRVAALDVPVENLSREEMEFTRRLHFGSAQLLLLGDFCVFDASDLQAYALNRQQERYPYPILPLGVSPDRGRFVRLVYGDDEQLYLQEIDLRHNRSVYLVIDEQRMRFANPYQIDPAWLSHHFEWKTDAQGDYRLWPRADFEPLPHHSEISLADPQSPSYAWAKVRPAFFAWLIE